MRISDWSSDVRSSDLSRIANDALGAARARVRAGRASPIEEQRADVARVNAEAAFENAQRILDSARANLGRRISRPVTGPLDQDGRESCRARVWPYVELSVVAGS